jgi:hypothetical protein
LQSTLVDASSLRRQGSDISNGGSESARGARDLMSEGMTPLCAIGSLLSSCAARFHSAPAAAVPCSAREC